MKFLAICLLLVPGLVRAEGNTIDDSFRVKEIKGQHAVVEGKIASLKAGDYLYFSRSPFKFSVESISGSLVTIKLPASHDLGIGQGLVRYPTEAMQKAIETEKKLKNALED